MTAAYDDDTISNHRQEQTTNPEGPVDFTSGKISETVSHESQEVKSYGENSSPTPSSHHDSSNRMIKGNADKEDSRSVNSTIGNRCIDENSEVTNDAEDFTIRRDALNISETCVVLRKQNFSEEIILNDKENIPNVHSPKEFAAPPPNAEDERKLCIEFANNFDVRQKSIISDGKKSYHSAEIAISPELTDARTKFRCQEREILERAGFTSGSANTAENISLAPRDKKGQQNLYQPASINRLHGQLETDQNDGIAVGLTETHPRHPIEKNHYSENPWPTTSVTCEEEYEKCDPECEISFHEAVRTGDATSVEMLVTRGLVQNVDEPDWNVSGDPPLLVAATNHSLPVLRTLLANGCDPAVRSPRGETALHRVITNGGPSNVLEIVEELLKHGCPATVKEAGGGLTALHVLTRQLAHAQNSKTLHNFDTALRTLDLLAKVGPVNAKDHQGRSALHILASSSTFGNSHKIEIEPMIKTLLDAGADPALQNDRGETPLHEALECGALGTAFLLVPHTPTGITSRYGETPLHIAARKNQPEVVDSLLQRGENPSLQDAGGNTPLHLASARGFHHTVSLLVTSPLAQLEKTNDEGLTSLQVAAESGFVNAVRLLLKAGADPSQTARYCVTTLHRHPDISTLINHELSRRRQLAA